MTDDRSLEFTPIDALRDYVETSAPFRAELYHAAHKSVELRSSERRGYHFRVMGRMFSMRTLALRRDGKVEEPNEDDPAPAKRRRGLKLYPGVYEIRTYGTYATRPKDDPEGQGYRYGTATIAFLTRHHLLSSSRLAEAIRAPQPDRLMPGQLADRLPRGMRREVLEDPKTLQLASLHQSCRETLGYSRMVYANIIGARTMHTVKNWEMVKSRVPAGVWPKLIELLKLGNGMSLGMNMSDEEVRVVHRKREAIKAIETLALGIAPRKAVSIAPQSKATVPLTREELHERTAEAAEMSRYVGANTPYMRRMRKEEREAADKSSPEAASVASQPPPVSGDQKDQDTHQRRPERP